MVHHGQVCVCPSSKKILPRDLWFRRVFFLTFVGGGRVAVFRREKSQGWPRLVLLGLPGQPAPGDGPVLG